MTGQVSADGYPGRAVEWRLRRQPLPPTLFTVAAAAAATENRRGKLGFLTWIHRKKKQKEKLAEEERKSGKSEIKEEQENETEKPKELQVTAQSVEHTRYRLTKLSKMKAIRLKNKKERREAFSQRFRRQKFFDSLIELRILKCERERRKQVKLRNQRMIEIVQKIAREMQTKKKKCLRKVVLESIIEESTVEFSMESFEAELEKEGGKEELAKSDETKKLEESSHEIKRNEGEVEGEGRISLEDNKNIQQFALKNESMSSTAESFPKDDCFFSSPNTVIFEDFKVGRKYSRRVMITNKTSKWAYLRFNKVYTEVWEPRVIEIDIMEAARVKPGMHATISVRFSPIHDEKVTAEISFLTLNSNNTKTFHEFRIPVVCTPENPQPILDPAEIRFPTSPMWRFNESRYNQKTLTVSNEGRKSFSILIGEQVSLHSVSSDLPLDEDENWKYSNRDSNENSVEEPRKIFQIEIPSKFKCLLKITFRPRYIGLHHEVMKICFFCDDRIFGEQDIPIWAEVTGSQIHLDPPCIDLGVAMMDSDVCQQTFNIINTGRSSVQISMGTPKRLGSQVTVYPRSTILQPEASSTISVRLKPESSIPHLSRRYYDATSSILEFPLHVQILTQKEEKPPPLILKVLASLTTFREPADIDLGVVYTHESVYTELTLTNDSLLIQEYAFVFLPPFMEIQPNHGLGTVLPGETIKLQLIYSACPTDIPGNEIGANGLVGAPRFQIQAVTQAELVALMKEIKISELRNIYDLEKVNLRNRGLPPSVDFEPFEVVLSKDDENDEDSGNTNRRTVSDVSVDEKDPDVEQTLGVSVRSYEDRRREKNVINVLVHIVNTLCEMSEQILEFPGTPCGSFSVVAVHLRGYNMASYPRCTCGIAKNQEKRFTAHFEFKSSSGRVKIVPQCGTLRSEQFVKVSFIFKPRLPRSEPMIDEPKEASKKDDSLKGKDEDEEETDVDKPSEDAPLLETIDPRVSTIFITCSIDLDFDDSTRRNELLFVKLICPVTRPEILILNKNPVIVFGPTAIGTSSRRFLLVKNISNKSVKVDLSLLDPYGPFFIPPGKTIETGSVLNLPVTYQPIHANEEEVSHLRVSFKFSNFLSKQKWTIFKTFFILNIN
ncbi:hypothetical protein WN55_11236 [Dufourea novaeangliae]|uniref:Uncharacterized protein n=1 Tax=Dufourea novaeangliae TaxID=178035 RepID=A0A154P9Y9_DUFNO|nr:hypothetical protein WN55_11236 [Dufourea novaeangliae]